MNCRDTFSSENWKCACWSVVWWPASKMLLREAIARLGVLGHLLGA